METGRVTDAAQSASDADGRFSLRIRDVVRMTGLGRTTIYEAMKSGRLVARKCGRCTLVTREDLQEFLKGLPIASGRQE
jgi:excisionase family DNA binding protein